MAAPSARPDPPGEPRLYVPWSRPRIESASSISWYAYNNNNNNKYYNYNNDNNVMIIVFTT